MTSNPVRGTSSIRLDDREYTLALGFEHIVELEDRLGMSVVQLAQAFGKGEVRAKYIAALLYAELAGGGLTPMPTFDEVGAMVLRHGVADVLLTLTKVLVAAVTAGPRSTVGGNPKGKAGKGASR